MSHEDDASTTASLPVSEVVMTSSRPVRPGGENAAPAPLLTSHSLGTVLDAIGRRRYRYASEIDLHEGLAAAFDAAGIEHEREVVVAGGRIDFVVDRLGIEVKVKGSASALEQQISRYCTEERLDEFLVVTTRPAHGAVPSQVRGKPVWVHRIGGLSL